jgi:hypothetical protein
VADLDHSFQKLCHEAVLACGSDMAAIERYVLKRIGAMDGIDRDRVRRDLDLVLAYRSPEALPKGAGSH